MINVKLVLCDYMCSVVYVIINVLWFLGLYCNYLFLLV